MQYHTLFTCVQDQVPWTLQFFSIMIGVLKYKQHNKQTLKSNGYFNQRLLTTTLWDVAIQQSKRMCLLDDFPGILKNKHFCLTKKERRKKTNYIMYNVQCKVKKFSFYLTSLVIFSSNRNNFLMTELSCHFLKLLQLFGKL